MFVVEGIRIVWMSSCLEDVPDRSFVLRKRLNFWNKTMLLWMVMTLVLVAVFTVRMTGISKWGCWMFQME
jgi:hypothetical protein